MKKKATSQSAFFNLRLLVDLFVALVGVSLLALGALATANGGAGMDQSLQNLSGCMDLRKVATRQEIGDARGEGDAELLGTKLAERLLAEGATAILLEVRSAGAPAVSEP